MARFGSIDRMPEAIRKEIGRLRQAGRTLDEILEHLRAMGAEPPSRSALGRHIKGLDKIGEQMRRSRDVAEALAREMGDAPESQTARLNIELLHSALLDVFLKAADGEAIDAAGRAALAGDPEGAMFLAKALDHLASASKKNADYVKRAEQIAEERAKKGAAAAVEAAAKEQGLSAATIASIKGAIFGVGTA